MTNPVLVHMTRAGRLESRHRGSVVVARPDGTIELGIGDVDGMVYPRSAIKAIQALPLIETGTADALAFDDAELALACASHSGEERHTETARKMLSKCGCDEQCLECGAHLPSADIASRKLLASGSVPSQLHNNCSGKHAGMIATAAHMGEPVRNYVDPNHPVQIRVREAISDVSGTALNGECCGIDGCSAPNWALPLNNLATAFARMVTGTGLSDERASAAQRLIAACFSAPEFVAGEDQVCTQIMAGLPGRAFAKTGAEGVYCAALPGEGLGIAIKIDDGAKRAAEVVVATILRRFLTDSGNILDPICHHNLTNWRGLDVGEITPAAEIA